MGMGYEIKCTNLDCEYSVSLASGVGFGFPEEYAKAMKKAKKGGISEAHTRFFAEHPEGVIDASSNIYQCRECGHLYDEPSYNMYLPKEGVKIPKDVRRCATPDDLHRYYRCCKRYAHKCPVCGGRSAIAKSVEEVTEKCPRCGSELRAVPMLWD